eukprot:6589070-Pyramimonas_sp.AAC.1
MGCRLMTTSAATPQQNAAVRRAQDRPQGPVADRLGVLGHEQPGQIHGLLAAAVGARARPAASLLLAGRRGEAFPARAQRVRQAGLREGRHRAGRAALRAAAEIQPVRLESAAGP